MPEYRYKAMLRDGRIIRNVITAKNKRDAVQKIKSTKRLLPIEIKQRQPLKLPKAQKVNQNQIKELHDYSMRVAKKNKPSTKSWKQLLTSDISLGVPHKDVLVFTNSLYILKKAGFNNVKALESIYDSTTNPKLRDIIDEMIIGVQSGFKINEMMQIYPKVFPALYINFVKVGEESGKMEEALLNARDYIESDYKLKKQIKGILLPKVLMFVGALVLLFVGLLWGAPMIEGVYDMFGSDATLPKATVIAANAAKFIVDKWYLFVAIIIGAIVAFRIYLNTAIGRYTWDRLKIKFPIIGRLSLAIITDKFFNAMLLNLRSGAKIQDALDLSKNVTDNLYFLSLVEIGKTNLLSGGSWLTPFEDQQALPPIVLQMVTVGMETDLIEMMDKVRTYVDAEIDETISKTVKALPEVTYVFIGIVLIFFVITIMVPMMEVYMGSFLF